MKSIIATLSKFISKIHIPYNHKKMTEEECEEIISILKPGDVVLSHTDGELSNLFLEYWGHGMIISTSGLYEAVTLGVRETNMMYAFSRKDDIIVLRPRFPIYENQLESWCKYAEGTSYDYNFETSAEKLYCFEMVMDSLIAGSDFRYYQEIINYKKTLLGEQILGSSFTDKVGTEFEVAWRKRI